METVRVLSTRYSLHIITNGFSEIQNIKMERGHTSIVYSVLKLWAFKNQMHGFFSMK